MRSTEALSVIRCRHDILRDILDLLNTGASRRTRVMYLCNLSSAQLKEYETALTDLCWMKIVDNLWNITDAGRAALRSLVNLKEVAA